MKFRYLLILTFLTAIAISTFSQIEIQNFKVQYDSARVNFNKGKYNETATWLEENLPTAKFQQKEATYWDMNNLLARCYVKLGKTKRAEEHFKETIAFYDQDKLRTHPNNLSATINLAYLYFGMHNYGEADKLYLNAMNLKRQLVGEKHPDFITLLNNVAVTYNVEGFNTKADSLYILLQKVKKEVYSENSPEYIQTLYHRANLFKNMGRLTEAEPMYVTVVTFRRVNPGEKSPEYMNSYKHLGQLYMAQRRYTEAEPIFLRLIDLNKLVYNEKHKEYTESLNNLGTLYIAMERYGEAEKLFTQVAEIRRSTLGKNHMEYGAALSNLGLLYRKMSKYTFAEKFYKKTLDIYEDNVGKKHSSYVATLVNLASLYREMGRFLDAETRYKKAKDIYVETVGENNVEYAGLLNNMAIFYTEMGKYELAERYYQESLMITENVLGSIHPDFAKTLNNLASLYKTMGRYEDAEGMYLRASKITREAMGEKNFDYATSLNNLGALYEIMGRYKESEDYYKEALKTIQIIFGEKHPVYANQLNNIAGLYDLTKEYAEAERLYNQALEIQSQVLGEKHPDYLATLNNLALLQQKTGNFDKAEELYKRNVNKSKATFGVKHPSYATALVNLAGLYEAMAKYRDAESLYNTALAIRKEALGQEHPDYGKTLTSLARLYTVLNQYVKADSMWNKAISLDLYEIKKYFPSMSEKEKGQFYSGIRIYFEQYNSYALIRVRTQPSILGKMYNNQLATKALLLNASNKLRHTILESGDTVLIHHFKEWLNQKEFLSKVYAMSNEDRQNQHINVDSLERLANASEKELSRSSETFKNANDVTFYTWQDVKKALKPGEAAMEIIRFPKFKFDSAGIYQDSVFYAALIVKPTSQNSPELILMRDGAAMETKLLKYYRNSIKTQGENEYCYKYFWKEIANSLKGYKKVYVSPDGAYNQMNINTLQNMQTKMYVFDEIEVQIVANTKDLVIQKPAQNAVKSIILCGNPNFMFREKSKRSEAGYDDQSMEYKQTLPPLPGTEAEVKQIDQIASQNAWQSRVYTGSQVTEERVKKFESAKVIHIATHGFFENDVQGGKTGKAAAISENPLLRSGLMLAGSDITMQNKKNGYIHSDTKSEDGILTAYEAMNLSLDHTDLVVLSACETGLGEVKNGEGVYGLQRSFQVAGARSIVNSLWTVNDQTTMLLMTSFYKEWMRTGDRKQAFRTAQSTVRKQFSHPYYWGAFVMIGD
ncbi:MAG: CHAT domain-containing tetratricopeptide repeat protein [Bacteroidota bacterium]|nr:CHAT domain-containing tetratricopeptide repeat protein [Bacteroidota bacterium]